MAARGNVCCCQHGYFVQQRLHTKSAVEQTSEQFNSGMHRPQLRRYLSERLVRYCCYTLTLHLHCDMLWLLAGAAAASFLVNVSCRANAQFTPSELQ